MPIDLAEVTGAKAAMEKKKHEPKIANGLNKDAFMKLFLEQLKNQDPTAPMETDKIISQTAQLSQVEMQEENKKAMKEVADAMQSTKETNKSLKDSQGKLQDTLENLNKGMNNTLQSNMAMAQVAGLNSVSMIGKIAETDVKGINVTKGKVDFSLYFDEPIKVSEGSPGVQIFDKDKQLVRTLSLKEKNGKQGYVAFEWDGLNDQGKPVPAGTYEVFAEYNLDPTSNKYLHTRIGRGEIQGVVFDKGKPMLRMGEMILPMDSALEFYDKTNSRQEKEQRENIAHFVPSKTQKPPAPTQNPPLNTNQNHPLNAPLNARHDTNAPLNPKAPINAQTPFVSNQKPPQVQHSLHAPDKTLQGLGQKPPLNPVRTTDQNTAKINNPNPLTHSQTPPNNPTLAHNVASSTNSHPTPKSAFVTPASNTALKPKLNPLERASSHSNPQESAT
ncbi:flagellar hook assembly protein FlgD [Helicobacter suis]|uniref:flagellar hook assembly protein FlgD n=1 Tax=Helicobacter suis TaxID=104628 RepID=UPI0013D4417F|nr:flagellar hook assembly protein FlgD [Helicobacter suis]